MTPQASHSTAAAHLVPKPFRAFAVRSDQPQHAHHARTPYGRVHTVRTQFLDARTRHGLATQGYARVSIDDAGDVDHASITARDMADAAPLVSNLNGCIAAALQLTGVLGHDTAAYRRSVVAGFHYLASRGAGFHNDVQGHWSHSLFWVLALDLHDVDFVMPHAGLRLPLAPGDLLVFDQTMAHGLCRSADRGRMVHASFDDGISSRQLFLTGELPLDDAQWAALASPWLPVEEHERRGALDLMVATFDACSGAIQQLRALAGCMQRSVCHIDVHG